MCSGEDAEADAVDVFLNRGVDDHLRRLAKTGVNDFHTGVAESAGDDFGAAIVAVESGLGYEDANWGGCCGHEPNWADATAAYLSLATTKSGTHKRARLNSLSGRQVSLRRAASAQRKAAAMA